jgi:nucleoside-diphosphate-sugar epimerase
VGTATSAAKGSLVGELGAEPVVLDVLDRDAVMAAVLRAEPEVVIHQATALSGFSQNMRRFDKTFAATNRLRTLGTDNLLEAARAAGARRFVAQSFTGWTNPRSGTMVKTEDDPLDPHPLAATRETMAGIRHVESAATGAEGIEGVALRYGGFYGPGTSLAWDGEHAEVIRKRQFPIVGEGTGVWSFTHIEDAAYAALAAAERGAPGIYNIVDDDPAPVREWLPVLAAALGAKPPRHLPLWLGRLVGGELVAAMMTEQRGSSNAKAKRELGWEPRWASWRDGFPALAPVSEAVPS